MLVCLGELKILFIDNLHQGPYADFKSGELGVILKHIHAFIY